MAATRKKSIKQNRAKRVSQFKQGHSALYRKCSDIDEASSSKNDELSSFEIQDDLSLVNRAGCSQERTGADELPYRLRPGVEKDYSESSNINTAGKSSSSSTQSFSENENIIVNVKKLEKLLISFAPHSCESSRSLSLDIVERQGLCVTVTVNCRNCSFETPKCALFTTMKSARGPDAGCVNTMMLIPVLKSRVGLNDLHLFLSCVNIRAPDLRRLQRKLNQLTDKIENLNKKQMLLNQQYVKRIQTFAGLSNESDMEFDVSYNSRPQQGCGRATQSFAPLIEQTTTRHLPIAIETANKLCTKQKCQHYTNSCKRNYNPHDSIQSTEPKLLKSNLNSVHQQNIKLSNTNQCESIHSQLFRLAPKYTAWSRNFTGLCHSVVHSACLGTGKSILKTAELLKIPVSRSDPFFQHMIKVDTVSKFYGRRQATVRYKSLRHLRRKGKVNLKLLSMSVYGGDQQIDQEHDYGINAIN